MDKNAIREISDVVADEVMTLVQKQLADEKPELANAIANQVIAAVNSKYNSVIHSLMQKNSELERRLDIMERSVSSQSSACSKDDVQNLAEKYQKIEERIESIETRQINGIDDKSSSSYRKPAKAVNGITTLSETQMEEILSYPGRYCVGNGWIYYVKVKDRSARTGELFKVHKNGTENQKIFSGTVDVDLWSGEAVDFKLCGDVLYFKSHLIERSIRV